MTTRAELNNLVRRRLNDQTAPSVFTDEQINQWINDAIEEYSRYFPARRNETVGVKAGERIYELPQDYRGIISVEYPTGQDPPAYLDRRDYRHPEFWLKNGYYDIVHRTDAANADEIWITEVPTGTGAITLEFMGDHVMLDEDTDVTDIPDLHLELITQHVRWSSIQALASAEAGNPDPNNVMLDRYEANATRAERTFYKKVEELQKLETESGMQPWAMDKWDRAY
jgi:hypothetical protein